MGFQFPASGEVRLFGRPPGDARSRLRIGYLPEVALYYPFMKGRELLELYGGLHQLSRAQLRERGEGFMGEIRHAADVRRIELKDRLETLREPKA